MRVPYLARFYLYARRHSADEVAVRALCLTEPDRAENPLELREDFKELCRSEFIEVYDKTEIHVKFSGNLQRVVNAGAGDDDNKEEEPATAASGYRSRREKEKEKEKEKDNKSVTAQLAGASVMGDTGRLTFRPFSENRQAFVVRRRNVKNPYPKGRVTFFAGVDRTLYEAKVDLTKFL